MNLRLQLARRIAGGFGNRAARRTGSQFGSVSQEISSLRDDLCMRLTALDGRGLLLRGQIQDCARFESVDVVVHERIWVVAQHGNQHLIQRNAIGHALGCNSTGGIAFFNRDLLGVALALLWRSGRLDGCNGFVGRFGWRVLLIQR